MGENTSQARAITFPYVGEIKGSKVWRNTETGVEIIKGANFAEVGLYYVAVPALSSDARTVVTTADALAKAREYAARAAGTMREEIAAAYGEAVMERIVPAAIDKAHAEALWENWARRPEADKRNARIMVGLVSVAVDAPEQVTAWRKAHGIALGVDTTVEDYINAYETDHGEALAVDLDADDMAGRIVRRAQYEALRAVLGSLDGWVAGARENHEALGHRDFDCCETFHPNDIRRMVNAAARELGVRRPWNGAAR